MDIHQKYVSFVKETQIGSKKRENGGVILKMFLKLSGMSNCLENLTAEEFFSRKSNRLAGQTMWQVKLSGKSNCLKKRNVQQIQLSGRSY